MPQIQGAEGEAVVRYREPLATPPGRGRHRRWGIQRLSRRANKKPEKHFPKYCTFGDFQDVAQA